jgi:uncharacterized protein
MWPKAKLIHDKLTEAFNGIQTKHNDKMQCQSGCSKCCHKKFSIFSWEAEHIKDWFYAFSQGEQNALQEKWNSYKDQACYFLYQDQCTIYPVRPSICRTQGAPFYIEGKIDVCPLNFENIQVSKNDALDLERINQLVAAAQIEFEQQSHVSYQRISLDELGVKLTN